MSYYCVNTDSIDPATQIAQLFVSTSNRYQFDASISVNISILCYPELDILVIKTIVSPVR